VVQRADIGTWTAVLLETVPGWTAGELARRRPQLARTLGHACAAVQDLLGEVRAPEGVAPTDPPYGSRGGRLLHLDLHPFNIMVEDTGVVTGVLDWANAAAGDPDLDRARSWSILTLDPAVRRRRSAVWDLLAQAWLEAGALASVPAAARAWACTYMLSDLAHRYSAEDLVHVEAARRAAR
jgi:aminoglycoside phosphotransferase (APT) family kinase protein